MDCDEEGKGGENYRKKNICSTCHQCIRSIRVLKLGVCKFSVLMVLNAFFGFDRNLLRFWVIFCAVFRFLIDPNAPLFAGYLDTAATAEGVVQDRITRTQSIEDERGPMIQVGNKFVSTYYLKKLLRLYSEETRF